MRRIIFLERMSETQGLILRLLAYEGDTLPSYGTLSSEVLESLLTFPVLFGERAPPIILGEVNMCKDSLNDLGRCDLGTASEDIIGSWSSCKNKCINIKSLSWHHAYPSM